jgi:hypothetical protein
MNAVLMAGGGAVLAGVGQLAGSGVLSTHPAPRAVLAAVLLAILSVVLGVAFVTLALVSSRARYHIEHGVPSKIDPGKRHHLGLNRQQRLNILRGNLEAWFTWLPLVQLLTWLCAAGFYAYLLLHVTGAFNWEC